MLLFSTYMLALIAEFPTLIRRYGTLHNGKAYFFFNSLEIENFVLDETQLKHIK